MLKKAIVTGASGFIGKSIVRRLISQNVEVTAVDILPFPERGMCRSIVADVTDKDILDPLLDAETTVFHMAARADVKDSVIDPRIDFQNNLYGLFEVLESARKKKSRVIFPSTASIFDPENSYPLLETAYVKPSSPYSAAKVAGEAYCSAYHRCYDLDVRIARMFSVYGIGMDRFAIHDIVRKIQKDSVTLNIYGDGNQIRDYLNIEDAVDGLILIATKGQAGEDYNLASGEPVKIIDLTRKIAALMGYPDINIIPSGESFTGDVQKFYGDISKIMAIGFKPKISLENGLKSTIEWLIETSKQH